jgi:GTP pyrophosphokinase/guanosine-3',5'-bis(diphosphate) 3'-pyrophosphohydrolase
LSDAPPFIAGREELERAYAFALGAHHGPAREGDTDIDHPVAVAALLDGAGFGSDVVSAALLHDVVEDTAKGLDELEAGFGPEVRGLVEVMTEDPAIEDYGDRKAEHRERVLAAGGAPASIYLADKLARARAYRASGEPVEMHRLEHYWDTLELYAGRRPELPFLAELAAELPELVPAPESAG